MRNLLYPLLAITLIVVFLYGCNKKYDSGAKGGQLPRASRITVRPSILDGFSEISDSTVLGKWTYTHSRTGIGGIGEWMPVQPPKFLQLNASGGVGGDYFRDSIVKFTVAQKSIENLKQNILIFTNPDGTFFAHEYWLIADTLYLNQARLPYICTEGCTSRFERMH